MSHQSRVFCGRTALLVGALMVVAADAAAQFQQGGRGGNQDRAVVAQFDADKDGRLNTAERQAARQALESGGGRGFGGGGRGRRQPGAGQSRCQADVQPTCSSTRMRRSTTRRRSGRSSSSSRIPTGRPSWSPSTTPTWTCRRRVTVDGRVYRDVGVHFRGNSSFGVGNGYKRSLNLTFDFVHENQAIGGYRTLNFLNANADPTLMRTVLSMHIARQYIPAPKANFVRVVINGENWGIYANAQQFNKEFVADNFKTTKGARWKMPQGGGGGVGGFTYLGDDASRYTGRLPDQVEGRARGLVRADRSGQDAAGDAAGAARSGPGVTISTSTATCVSSRSTTSWSAAMASITRAADYSLYRHPDGRFHFVFHDANEMFSAAAADAARGRRHAAESAGRAERREQADHLEGPGRAGAAREVPRLRPRDRREVAGLERHRPCRQGSTAI